MKVHEVKEIARRWVAEEASRTPGFLRAFFLGSINWKAEGAPFPSALVVDTRVVIDTEGAVEPRLETVLREGVIPEPSYESRDSVRTLERVLSGPGLPAIGPQTRERARRSRRDRSRRRHPFLHALHRPM